MTADGKYHMLPSGELLVTNVSRIDAQKSYRCRTHHQLTQEAIVSANAGRIQLSGESVPGIFARGYIHRFTSNADEFLKYSNPDRWMDGLGHDLRQLLGDEGNLVLWGPEQPTTHGTNTLINFTFHHSIHRRRSTGMCHH